MRKLELTGEQREKAGAILQEAYLEAMARALGKVKAEVLTDEQAGKLNVDKVVQELRGKPGKPRATKHRGQVEGRPEGKRKKVEAEGKEAL